MTRPIPRHAEIAMVCTQVACLAAWITSGVVFLGWLFEAPQLKSVFGGGVAMNPATALAFTLAAAAMWLLAPQTPSAGSRRAARICAGLVVAWGLIRLIGYARGLDIALDNLLFAERLDGNRMAPNTALYFMLLGAAILAADAPGVRRFALSQGCALVLAVAALLSIAGYVYGANNLIGVGAHIPIAFNTAAIFLTLAIGVLLMRPHRGVARVLFDAGPGGLIARLLIPVSLLLPMFLGWLRIEGQRADWYSYEFGVALMAIVASTCLCAIVWLAALRLNYIDRQRRRTDDELRQAYAKVQQLYNEAPCGYHSLDAEGRFLAINNTELAWLGYTREEVVNRLTFKDVITLSSRAKFAKSFPEFKRLGEIRDLRFDMLRKDGSTFPVLLSARALQDEHGRFAATSSTVFDITELERARQEVERLNEGLEQRVAERTSELARANQRLAATNRDLAEKSRENETFVYSVSHDLRSPLVNLQGYSREVQMVCDELRSVFRDPQMPPSLRERGLQLCDHDMADCVHFIQSSVSRLSGIIDALLELSRAGRVEYRVQRIETSALVQRVIDSLSHSISERDVLVSLGPLPAVQADNTAVEQIFANLIGNAINYVDPSRPGRVRIECCRAAAAAGECHTFAIIDNGRGIDEAYRGKVFQAFQRVHAHAAPGEGMGLTIVQRAVERHEGKIWFDSMVGIGTTFYFTLPAADNDGSESPIAPQPNWNFQEQGYLCSINHP